MDEFPRFGWRLIWNLVFRRSTRWTPDGASGPLDPPWAGDWTFEDHQRLLSCPCLQAGCLTRTFVVTPRDPNSFALIPRADMSSLTILCVASLSVGAVEGGILFETSSSAHYFADVPTHQTFESPEPNQRVHPQSMSFPPQGAFSGYPSPYVAHAEPSPRKLFSSNHHKILLSWQLHPGVANQLLLCRPCKVVLPSS